MVNAPVPEPVFPTTGCYTVAWRVVSAGEPVQAEIAIDVGLPSVFEPFAALSRLSPAPVPVTPLSGRWTVYAVLAVVGVAAVAVVVGARRARRH